MCGEKTPNIACFLISIDSCEVLGSQRTDYCYQGKNMYRHQNILCDRYRTITIYVCQDDKSESREQEQDRLPDHCTVRRAIDGDYRLHHRACQKNT